jgi:nicotinamidase/pyrazinamidase
MPRYEPDVALIVVDVQNDFADPAGSLSVLGGVGLIPRINREIRRATSAGAQVVATQDWHPASTPHFAKDGGIWPVHCVAETWGAAFHPDLELTEATLRVRKGSGGEDGYSGFTMREPTTGEQTSTELDKLLRERAIERLVVLGLATDYCVQATAIDGAHLGYETTVLIDACAAVNLQADDGTRALDAMRDAGVTIRRTVV